MYVFILHINIIKYINKQYKYILICIMTINTQVLCINALNSVLVTSYTSYNTSLEKPHFFPLFICYFKG